ncbi:MAG: phospho-N-acetylmuramoyl-pentapeptide-transferase [Ruminococcus sp.]|nr:phospho-N-acetylmuramoyl-pentapeptide-transferase [Ruminococcus sp.]
MLYNILDDLGNSLKMKGLSTAIMFLASFVLVVICLKVFRRVLPKDQGREFAVNGSLSEGKARGAGIIFVTCFVFLTALFIPLSMEIVLYMVLIYIAMLSGYFDDASDEPWGNLKKGLIDLVVSGGIAGVYYYYNSSRIFIAVIEKSFTVPPVVFIILATILVWASINVTNCADGVDGLCTILCMISIFFINRMLVDTHMMSMGMIMLSVLGGYLWYNCSPSTILMGDAGSRALGVLLALMCLKTGSPLVFIPFAFMLIVDGGMGLIKVSFIRFLKIKGFMKNIRTPIHDHVRKNKGWSDTQVVTRFSIVQIIICICYYMICN